MDWRAYQSTVNESVNPANKADYRNLYHLIHMSNRSCNQQKHVPDQAMLRALIVILEYGSSPAFIGPARRSCKLPYRNERKHGENQYSALQPRNGFNC